jgi:hypothetical protein
MPFYNFVKCLVKGDLSYIGGRGKDRKKAWENIFNEYLSLSENTSTKHYLSILKDIHTITARLIIIETIVNSLMLKYHPGLVKQLQAFGFRSAYLEGDGLAAELEKTIAQCKMQLVTLHQRKQELAGMEQVKGKEATERDYELQLSEMSKFQGYHINSKNITVSEYCAIMSRFKEQNKA